MAQTLDEQLAIDEKELRQHETELRALAKSAYVRGCRKLGDECANIPDAINNIKVLLQKFVPTAKKEDELNASRLPELLRELQAKQIEIQKRLDPEQNTDEGEKKWLIKNEAERKKLENLVANANANVINACILFRERITIENLQEMLRLARKNTDLYDVEGKIKDIYTNPEKRNAMQKQLAAALKEKFTIEIQGTPGQVRSYTVYGSSANVARALMATVVTEHPEWKDVTITCNRFSDKQLLAAAEVGLAHGVNLTFKNFCRNSTTERLNTIFEKQKALQESAGQYNPDTKFTKLFTDLRQNRPETLSTYLSILSPANIRRLFEDLNPSELAKVPIEAIRKKLEGGLITEAEDAKMICKREGFDALGARFGGAQAWQQPIQDESLEEDVDDLIGLGL